MWAMMGSKQYTNGGLTWILRESDNYDHWNVRGLWIIYPILGENLYKILKLISLKILCDFKDFIKYMNTF